MKPFKQITIVGVGLLGGSLARAVKQKGLAETIVGCGRNARNLKEAQSLKIIDSHDTDPAAAVKGSDCVVLCSPVGSMKSLMEAMLPALEPGCLITDVGSVKRSVVQQIEPLLPDGVAFIGSHPIAGGEKSGLHASSATLFENAHCIVTPTPRSRPEALARIRSLWEKLGMQVKTMDVDEHDFIFGAVSHLPHIVAYVLMNTIGDLSTENHSEITSFCGKGLKDVTRIAGSDPVMWRDICVANKLPVLNLIDDFQVALLKVRKWIDEEDGSALKESFASANRYRLKLT